MNDLIIVIENKKGTHKSFDIENDPIWKDYPLKGVTYPVDYGFIEGYASEDGHDLDVFRGSGKMNGYIRVWRYDVPIETKFAVGVTESEWKSIISIFEPVIKDIKLFDTEVEYRDTLAKYKR